MEEGDSQTQQVGPTPTAFGMSVGTYVSIKKNKQTLSRMYERIRTNYTALTKTSISVENRAEMANVVSTIVEFIESVNVADPNSMELAKISVFIANMILCVDVNYRDDILAASKSIFHALSNYFNTSFDAHHNLFTPSSNTSNSLTQQSQQQSTAAAVTSAPTTISESNEYQALVLIYKLLMATRQPTCDNIKKPSSTNDSSTSTSSQNSSNTTTTTTNNSNNNTQNSSILMRERLINKDFMRRIFEISPEEFAPGKPAGETYKMLIAFYSLFARKKDRIVSFGFVRQAKDCFFTAITALHEMKTENISLHQAIGCLSFTMDSMKLNFKEIQKNGLIPILCESLENQAVTSTQTSVILRMLLALSKSNIINSKTAYQTMCLGIAFKVFEKAPNQAFELITTIYTKDPLSLKNITLQTTLSLLRDLTVKWNEVTLVRRNLKSNQDSFAAAYKRAQADIEVQLKHLVSLIITMQGACKDLLLQLTDIEVILFPLLNSLEVTQSSASSANHSEIDHCHMKIEDIDEDHSHSISDHQNSSTASGPSEHPSQPASASSQAELTFAPQDLSLYDAIVRLVENALAQSSNINASSNGIHANSHNYSIMVFNKLVSLQFPDVCRGILAILQNKYNQITQSSKTLSAEVLSSIQAYYPFIACVQRILSCFASRIQHQQLQQQQLMQQALQDRKINSSANGNAHFHLTYLQ